ncbi:MAG: class I SAM-dependent methyltransferase [Thermodesulfobacteriota bacterium]|nr:class I SAM-dependent methyltransferase [Thermodesulfobacteriota bacterium]
MPKDLRTSLAFAQSWNDLPKGSVYTSDQFEDWLHPIKKEDISGKTILELGCGNGSLLTHMAKWLPSYLEGVDLGDSVKSARENMALTDFESWEVIQADLISYGRKQFDFVYSIGVLHHLKDPEEGFRAVERATKPGGRFHCWVYGYEGNFFIRAFVDPLRKIVFRLPWFAIKHLIAFPLTIPFFLASQLTKLFENEIFKKIFPMYSYLKWISRYSFRFHHHVACDQILSPQTTYIKKQTIEKWLDEANVENTYIIQRNGNSWKFGGDINISN